MQAIATTSFLICRSGECRYALPLAQVIETMRVLPTVALASMPSYLLGMSTIRGEAIPVIDLAGVVGTAPAGLLGRYITLRVGKRMAAAAVEGVIGVRTLRPETLDTLPPLLCDAQHEVVTAITLLDADLLLVLHSAHLIPEPVWATLTSGSVTP